MSRLYLHHPKTWVNFLQDSEFDAFLESYQGQKITIGDLSLWSTRSIQKLLILLEKYPQVDVYSSVDLYLPILYSRFVEVVSAPTMPPIMPDEMPDQPSYQECLAYTSAYRASLLLQLKHSKQSSIIKSFMQC